MNKKITILIVALLAITQLFSQGTVRGTILDAKTGETVPFANVLVKETETGNTTDFDGVYTLSLDAGIYTVEFSFLGYATLTVPDVEVKDGEETLLDVSFEEEGTLIEEVVVTASAINTTETAVLTIQRKALGLLDGVSTQAIKRTGDSDVGGAVKRVTGVSVQEGKYIVVRGLGDRYSKTSLNGMDVPGLDPDKNSVQLDIFPTNLVDNIIVYKSFTPNLPGDFTGGMVDILTKDFPEKKTISLSAGASYNPTQHFNKNYITSQGGGLDWLGFDDGTRKLPQAISAVINDPNQEIPSVVRGDQNLQALTGVFRNNLATLRQSSSLNHNYSASYGDQKNLGKFDLGYTVSGNYRNETEYLEDVEFNTYFKQLSDPSDKELFQDISNRADRGANNVQWSTLAGLALKSQKHKISLSALHSQNAVSKAAFILNQNFEFNPSDVQREVIEFSQRSVSNILLAGKHSLGTDGGFKVNWKLSPTFSKMDEPDIRQAAYETTNGDFEINRSVGANVTRTYRAMEERNYSAKVDLEYAFQIGEDGLESKVKGGVAGVDKERDFGIDNFIFPIHRAGSFTLSGDANELFDPALVWAPDSDRGLYVQGNTVLSNQYNAKQQILAGYVMHEYPISDRFKATYGARVEKVEQRYTGQRQIIRDPAADIFNDRKILDELNVLPSVSLVYKLVEDRDNGKTMNLRGSFSQTLARPSFKEKSIAQIEDRISGRTFIGNIDLEQTEVVNADLRWEYFMPSGQIFSASTFYKGFTNPIELTAFDATSPNSFTPRNVGDAKVYGIEFELRRNLSFLSENLAPLSLSLNTTIVKSQVEMSEEELEGRRSALRTGEELATTRDMVGQSPYVINAGVTYNSIETGLVANISYNVQGRRLAILGIGQVPDVYEVPFNALNMKVSKRFGSERQFKASFTAGNLLGSKRVQEYQSFEAANQVFEQFNPGRNIGFSIGYTLQ